MSPVIPLTDFLPEAVRRDCPHGYRNSAKSSSLPDLRKYPSGTPRKKAFLRTVMPYITSQNPALTA
ncbi:hypothetical protein E2K61_13380, partial [Escherichia coli]